ncbi:MAG TPA: 1,4-dihydroxy-2-naphthoate octaprenyltransferase [Thauera aminoaromatica]|nr:1,4-dihydroxy-2-naphthoate octaprenyltransferase [Pseudomonadota bacterium]HNF75578.1 1,4-dihydroxy-2-naphthoate octaprenyltransferase [Thauera aminoaromatica]HNV89890.1 1,4-dihydroxy-2-naphthoate octaprenyltransferase [Thauera aminoaromatica]HPV61836.1 1,4-dihydroxy-2-naphthoate octaprenyltransferase [Thauera aminoaromatica]HRG70065.1 1,4-dihydroxy-2-naphthoate octaprenyltransferase [Thauera aminoaromatica]
MTPPHPAPSRPGTLAVWWAAIRPRTLGMALAPVMLGTALAVADGAELAWAVLFATVSCALLIQIGTNLYNDAIDFERGTDRPERLGPLRVTLAGWASAAEVKRGALLCLLLALLLGAWLCVVGGALILAIGLASLIAGWAYSGGPRPISHSPLGELFVLLFFGVFAVLGSHWLQSRALGHLDLLAGLAVGAPAAAVLLVNNYRDLAGDLRAGRRTLAALLGAEGARRAFALLVLLPIPTLILIAASGAPGAILGLVGAPALAPLVWRFGRAEGGPALNALLVDTARAGTRTGLLAAAGIVFVSSL